MVLVFGGVCGLPSKTSLDCEEISSHSQWFVGFLEDRLVSYRQKIPRFPYDLRFF